MTGPSYRSAAEADVATIRALLLELAAHDGGHPTGTAEQLRAHGFGPRPLWHGILAEDTAPMGLAIFYPDFSTVRGQPGLFVQDLYVRESARGTGVGRGLLAAAAKAARRDWGAAYLTLGVSPGNAGAKALYERMGFQARGYEFLILEGSGWNRLGAT